MEELYDLAIAEMEKVRCLRLHLRNLRLTALSTTAAADEDEDTPAIELDVLLGLHMKVVPSLQVSDTSPRPSLRRPSSFQGRDRR
jgi:hypothetical protein